MKYACIIHPRSVPACKLQVALAKITHISKDFRFGNPNKVLPRLLYCYVYVASSMSIVVRRVTHANQHVNDRLRCLIL